MAISYTARQGQFLAFIHGYTVKHGYAPSFEDIGAHFGITTPSVHAMIKTLEQRGLLDRLPGVARSLRVLVPATSLPSGEFGSYAKRATSRPTQSTPARPVGGIDAAATAAIAVLDTLMPLLLAGQTTRPGASAVIEAAQAVDKALAKIGLSPEEAAAAARQIASEAARWDPEGRGTVIRKWHWVWEGSR